MATATRGRPGRALLALLVIALAMGGWMAWKGATKPKLGLDLQGGTTVTLVPSPAPGSTGTITDDAIKQAVEIISARVNGAGVAEAEVAAQGRGDQAVIVVSVPGLTEDKLVEQLGQTAQLGFRPVLDAQPSVAPVPSPSPSPTGSGKKNKNQNGGQGGGNGALMPRLGTAAGDVRAGGQARQARTTTPARRADADPNAADHQHAGADASSDLDGCGRCRRPSCSSSTRRWTAPTPSSSTSERSSPTTSRPSPATATATRSSCSAPVAVPGSDIDSASANLSQNTAGWIVSLDFNSTGTKEFGKITAQMAQQPADTAGNRFAIVLDGVVVSAPGVNEAIPGGQAQITGQFTQQEATDLANVLKFGALPADLRHRGATTPSRRRSVPISCTPASLPVRWGWSSSSSTCSFYYRALALVAVASLLIAGLFTYGAVVILGETLNFTLTLAGVAGLIVAIGITADSFIVYFERIRDEVREGRSLRAALEAGWVRARRTIIAADFISLIAAAVLWVLSVGGVRGFAFTLGLTTIIDLVVVFLFTKPLVTLLARTKFFNSGSRWSGLSPDRLGAKQPAPAAERSARSASTLPRRRPDMSRLNTFTSGLYRGDVSFDFVGRAKQWYIVSAVMLIIALGSLAVNGLKFGVEFSAGPSSPFPATPAEIARGARRRCCRGARRRSDRHRAERFERSVRCGCRPST